MSRTEIAGRQFSKYEVVTALPAAGSLGRMYIYGSKLYFDNGTDWLELTANATAYVRTNWAASANGAVASASSSASTAFQPYNANNGYRYANPIWSNGQGGWDSAGTVPAYLQIDFAASKPVSEIDVFTLRDSFDDQSAVTFTETFTNYGITAFNVQYWDGSAWVTFTQADGSSLNVTGNNKVGRKFSVQPVSTTKIRCNVTGANGGAARIVELEAWG